MHIELDARLNMLAALTPACHCAADVGADHGFLGAWLLENRRCERVQLLDISAPSLSKAQRLIEEMQLEDRAVCSVGDGLDALVEPAQAVIIAGMGGPTIAGIIERGRDRLHGARLILQPNVGIRDLRSRICEMGFKIVDERIARTGGRWYIGIAAEEGTAQYSETELLAGPVILRDKPSELANYADFRIRVLQKAYDGAVHGSKHDMTAELKKELEQWKEIRSWM